MPDWHLLAARFSVFVTPETSISPTLWRDVVGEDAETSSLQRATATRIETGPYGEGTLRLQTQPMRIDWFYEPVPSGAEGGVPPTFGRFPDAAEPFLDFVRRWATPERFPLASRIALGFTLISRTPDRATGYRELAEFIDGVPTDDEASDFQYQINLPRPSRTGIDGLRINRLSQWAVGAFATLAVSTGEIPHSIVRRLVPHLRLELDVNTSAEFEGPIPKDRVRNVIDDLFLAATEICERGTRR